MGELAFAKEQRYKGKDFQVYVKDLLSRCGYLKGQLYSTTGEFREGYYEGLKEEVKRLNATGYWEFAPIP